MRISILVTAAVALAGIGLGVRPEAGSTVPGYEIVAWNDLGMHGMDADYSVFSIMPPYNTIEAQLIDGNGDLVTTPGGITMTYEAATSPSGSTNRTSAGKTGFWAHAQDLYGSPVLPDEGLAGFGMPGSANTPQAMTWDPGADAFRAEGIPITPTDDAGLMRRFPLMKLVARDATGTVLATADVALPVSIDMDCRLCHASTSGPDARPAQGWTDDANAERDYRLNILRLHDEQHGNHPDFVSASSSLGYSASGLEATVTGMNRPVLCAACHASNAIAGTGFGTIEPLTQILHAGHASVTDPRSGLTLDASANRDACSACHPGEDIAGQRGAMRHAISPLDGSRTIRCQSCHGSMSVVGDPAREGWRDEPDCQSCHTGTATNNAGQIRYEDAFASPGVLRVPADPVFATEPDVPAPGLSLYRSSRGHGGLRCAACHGPTHATSPSSVEEDNLMATGLQGYPGTVIECTACHDQEPATFDGGPHGMHPVGQGWVTYEHIFGSLINGLSTCRACHGTDDRGGELARAHTTRTYVSELGTTVFERGQSIGCYSCHNGPTSEAPIANTWPAVVAPPLAVAGAAPLPLPLTVIDPDPGQTHVLRVSRQPRHGTVTLSGTTATYRREAGWAGIDSFEVLAYDGFAEGRPTTVQVEVGASRRSYGRGFPGTGGTVPGLTLTGDPALGTTVQLVAGNASGQPNLGVLMIGSENARSTTPFGGSILVHAPVETWLVFPPGGFTLPLVIPNDPALVGLTLYGQVAHLDPQATHLVAFSQGLEVVFGR